MKQNRFEQDNEDESVVILSLSFFFDDFDDHHVTVVLEYCVLVVKCLEDFVC